MRAMPRPPDRTDTDQHLPISISIMAHPRRATMARQLQEQLGGRPPVIWDRYGNRWDTGRRALLEGIPASGAHEWHVVLQDDAVLCDRFLEHLEATLNGAPGHVVSLYMGRTTLMGVPTPNVLRRAVAQDASWIDGEGPFWGVGIAIRTHLIRPLVSRCDRLAHLEQYDVRLATGLADLRHRCLYAVPSLVDHRVGPGNPSLIEGQGSSRGRTALYFRPTGPANPPNGKAVTVESCRRLLPQWISLAVMAHESRLHLIPELYRRLGHFELVVDRGAGSWPTAIEAWQCRDQSLRARFHVVIQDDAIPCEDFLEALPEVLMAAPDACHGLHFGRNVSFLRAKAAAAIRAGQDHVHLDRLYWGVGIALPTPMIPRMLRWAIAYPAPDGWGPNRCDTRVSRWCMEHQVPVRYPLPSLLEHRALPSIVGGYRESPEERVAFWFRGNPNPVATGDHMAQP